jgi:Sec-independent protein translocase protein TatA
MMTMFAPKSVDSVLKAFQKTISDLDTVNSHHIYERDSKRTRATELESEAAAHHDEAQKARSIASKLSSIITA